MKSPATTDALNFPLGATSTPPLTSRGEARVGIRLQETSPAIHITRHFPPMDDNVAPGSYDGCRNSDDPRDGGHRPAGPAPL